MTEHKSMALALSDIQAQIETAQRARIELIREALKAGMTQNDIAFWASVSRRTVSEIAKSVRSEQAAS